MTQVPDIPLWLKQANTNKGVTITYKSVFNPHKILGHYKAPEGTSKVQENILINKAERYACKVKKSMLNRHKAWLYYTSCYLKSLGYVLGQTFFSKHTLENIDRPAIRASTSKCGYNCNMTYTIRDSPSQYGGAEFTPLYHDWGI